MGLSKEFKYRFCLQKAYFDMGFGLTSYVKWIIAFFGLASANVALTLIIGFFYGVSCYFIGRYWVINGWFEQSQEVSNKNNLFVKELRKRKV